MAARCCPRLPLRDDAALLCAGLLHFRLRYKSALHLLPRLHLIYFHWRGQRENNGPGSVNGCRVREGKAGGSLYTPFIAERTSTISAHDGLGLGRGDGGGGGGGSIAGSFGGREKKTSPRTEPIVSGL